MKTVQFLDNLSIVRSEADRLGRLVNDLLDLNKIESGRMEWRDEPLDVHIVIQRAAASIKAYESRNPGVRFIMDLPEDELPIVVADGDRLHQVMINLLSNAFKYTDSGDVTLSARRVQEGVEFMVCDTGRGIPEEDMGKVFDIFYQVQDVNQRSSKIFGTGLGLAISKQIVAHYGGKLLVESEVGKGSCFSFVMPVKQ